jgi:hypothetical protein
MRVTGPPIATVVVPARNAEAYLDGLFDSLDTQTLEQDQFETILVDDASRDATRELAEAWAAGAPGRRRIVSGAGRGPAAARNLGVEAAHGEWIVFTDADVLPDPRWLEALVAAGVGAEAVEGRVVPWPEAEIRSGSHYVRNEHGGLYVTANMAYRRRTIEQAGGFDERFTEPFLEDSDLAFRVLAQGARIRFAPDALVRHRVIPGAPARELLAARKLRWLPLLAAKHPERYASEIRPLFPPLTRPDAHVLAGLFGVALMAVGGTPRVAGALFAANAARVVALDPRLRVGPRDLPAQAAVAVALPVAKTAWRLVGHARVRWLRR